MEIKNSKTNLLSLKESLINNAKGAVTWNGALSNASMGEEKFAKCLEYWSKAGTYVDRSQEDVNNDMNRLFADDVKTALSIVFGLRLITRKPYEGNIDEVQTGYGRKDEFYKAITWVAENHPNLINNNLHLIPVFGCWKDFLNEPLIDVLDRKRVFELFRENLGDDLVRKYLPTIRNKRKEWSKETRLMMRANQIVVPYGSTKITRALSIRDCKRVEWAKDFSRFLGINYSDYRKLKSQGRAHLFQQQMSRNEWDEIDFFGIPGRAMFNFISRKGWDGKMVFERHSQIERLRSWVDSQSQIKFNGYPYELTKAMDNSPNEIQKLIYDYQWKSMIEPLRDHNLGTVWCALDVSGSMSWSEIAKNVRPIDVCLSLGLVFSELNVGEFKNFVVSFDNTSSLVEIEGASFSERYSSLKSKVSGMGSTNFQSVIDLLVRTRLKSPAIPIEDYPDTILVVSDMQFNPVGENAETNYEAAMRKLSEVGLSSVRIIWWVVNGTTSDFPVQMNDKNCYVISGFDPVNLKALMGLNKDNKNFDNKEKATPLQGMVNFLSQPIFSLLRV